ncbi:tetratricopeptide repeat protein [Pedobacter cryoconitis]|uniref:tetratricopeptide repeat protein n=1 Tax=Pedobacter cryoconitis TaxID=188932 RepID=UPI001611CB76|nr:DUF4365 domain-containing protein [Pedobacter cryoconitis]MBB5645909.1 tetratricopeptide (TPR) repeat protein [Pedobacter cryoconitis]
MTQFPSRHPNHSLEYKSELFLRNKLPTEWIIDKPTDYGIDFKIEVVLNGAVNGQNFSVQLKAHQKIEKRKGISVKLERTTVNLYLSRLEPLLLICYVAEDIEAYYCWFNERSVDLTKKNKTFSISFDSSKKVSELDWNEISSYVNTIFSRKFLLHAFPEFDFSMMGKGEKDAAAYYLKKDYETAKFLFDKLNKDNPNACWLNSIAMCQYGLYHYKDALASVNEALEITDLLEIKLNKASILAEYGIEAKNRAMVIEASGIFKSAIDEIGEAHHYFNYANTLTELGQYEEAEKHYKKALDLNPNYAESWKNLGHIYSFYRNLEKEMQCYNNALSIKPDLPQALICKGIALIKDLNNFNEGISYLKKALEADSKLFLKYTSGYFWFAYAYLKISDYENGLRFLEKGLKQYPGDPYLLNLKRDYLKDNWRKNIMLRVQAKEFMLYRLRLQSDDTSALECLCRILLYEKNKTAALVQLTKHTVIFQRTQITDIKNESFDIEPYLSSLYNYHNYCEFRNVHPLEKDLNSHLFPPVYIEFNELVGLKLFHECLQYIKIHKNDKSFEKNLFKHLFEQAYLYYPKTAPYMITANVKEPEAFGEQMCNAIIHIPILAMREVGRINGYLRIKLGLDSKKMDVAIKNANETAASKKIFEACLVMIQERFSFFSK